MYYISSSAWRSFVKSVALYGRTYRRPARYDHITLRSLRMIATLTKICNIYRKLRLRTILSCGESPNHFNFNITPHYVNQCTADCREAGTPQEGSSPVDMLSIKERAAFIDAI